MVEVIRRTAIAAILVCAVWAAPAPARAVEVPGLPFPMHGFVELGAGLRLQDAPHHSSDFNYGELRLQFEASPRTDWADFKLRLDLFRDEALDKFSVDLREANMMFFPMDIMDVKVGRQILTWGTGDLLFLNDLFPKDFQSFFIGREETYLKAPSDAVKVSLFPGPVNIDLVWVPVYNSDRFVDGERLSYFNPVLARQAGENDRLSQRKPGRLLKDSEVHLRLFRTVRGYELALYGYYGFFKNPGGFNPAFEAIFPRLMVYGGSVRGTVLAGIGNIEVAYYDSMDDRDGTDPFVENSQFRLLAGYTQEVVKNLSVGLQYNLERMLEHDNFLNTLPPGFFPRDRDRHLTTLRLTYMMLQQNLTLSLFTFYSPSDGDTYYRPSVFYKFTDRWSAQAGANVFEGDEPNTFFGQFEANTNAFVRVRYSY